MKVRLVALLAIVLVSPGISYAKPSAAKSAKVSQAKQLSRDRALIKKLVLSAERKQMPNARLRFSRINIAQDWAATWTCLVNEKGKDISDFTGYLLRRDKTGWKLVTLFDEGWIDKRECRKLGLSFATAKKLGIKTD